jgi:hypothetical protein
MGKFNKNAKIDASFLKSLEPFFDFNFNSFASLLDNEKSKNIDWQEEQHLSELLEAKFKAFNLQSVAVELEKAAKVAKDLSDESFFSEDDAVFSEEYFLKLTKELREAKITYARNKFYFLADQDFISSEARIIRETNWFSRLEGLQVVIGLHLRAFFKDLNEDAVEKSCKAFSAFDFSEVPFKGSASTRARIAKIIAGRKAIAIENTINYYRTLTKPSADKTVEELIKLNKAMITFLIYVNTNEENEFNCSLDLLKVEQEEILEEQKLMVDILTNDLETLKKIIAKDSRQSPGHVPLNNSFYARASAKGLNVKGLFKFNGSFAKEIKSRGKRASDNFAKAKEAEFVAKKASDEACNQ